MTGSGDPRGIGFAFHRARDDPAKPLTLQGRITLFGHNLLHAYQLAGVHSGVLS